MFQYPITNFYIQSWILKAQNCYLLIVMDSVDELEPLKSF